MVPEEHTNTTAALVVIGNEILSGKVTDSNSGFLARELRKAGVSLERISVIVDDIATIATEVAECAGAYDIVFTSGGVGPTHDDVTIEGIAAGFGVKTVIHPGLQGRLSRRYGNDLNAARLRMAMVPEGAELLDYGALFAPVVRVDNVYVFAGVPRILQDRFNAIKERFREAPYYLKNIYIKEGEGLIAETLNDLLVKYPKILLGSYPVLDNPDYKVKVTVESKNRE